ncbi:MAG: glutamate 5-kinase [Ahrensia sp.]|nr:glutamate 5-kinase [Ahrensia sp.]
MRADKTLLQGDHRVVVKVGSALLVDRKDGIRQQWLASLASDLAALADTGTQLLLVSSGAIALGRKLLDLPERSLKLDESQAAAAVGQIALGRAWSEALDKHGLVAGQVLLTLHDTEGRGGRRRYLNARDTLERLIGLRALPVINENDTIATSEIRYGDNDRLAARVATMANADLLVLLSDVDGLYDAPPATNANARFIEHVPRITPQIEAMAGSAASTRSRGGMVTKIEAGKIATASGTAMVIASGTRSHPIRALLDGERASWFDAQKITESARKTWIAGQLETVGRIILDAGAVAALRSGKSLLPAGVTQVEGRFSRGDAVTIAAPDGSALGHGLIGYNDTDARKIIGLRSDQWETALGYAGRPALIHRDDMALDPTMRHDGTDTARQSDTEQTLER